jgi:hypothetical protein
LGRVSPIGPCNRSPAPGELLEQRSEQDSTKALTLALLVDCHKSKLPGVDSRDIWTVLGKSGHAADHHVVFEKTEVKTPFNMVTGNNDFGAWIIATKHSPAKIDNCSNIDEGEVNHRSSLSRLNRS